MISGGSGLGDGRQTGRIPGITRQLSSVELGFTRPWSSLGSVRPCWPGVLSLAAVMERFYSASVTKSAWWGTALLSAAALFCALASLGSTNTASLLVVFVVAAAVVVSLSLTERWAVPSTVCGERRASLWTGTTRHNIGPGALVRSEPRSPRAP